MRKIKGDALLGFGDFFEAGTVVGAAAAADRPGYEIGAKKSAKPGKPVPLKKYPKKATTPGASTVEKHGKVLAHAHKVANHAVQSVMKGVKLIGTSPHGTVSKSHVGQISPSVATTPKARAAVQKHNAAQMKAGQATKALAQHLVKTKASIANLAKRMVIQKKAAVALRTPVRKRTHVGHLMADPVIGLEVAQAFQDYYSTVGAIPDRRHPGYLTDGSLDPAQGNVIGQDSGAGPVPTGGAPTDRSAPSPTDGGAGATPTAALSDPSLDPTGQDSGASLPAPPDMSTFTPDMTVVGGIAYNGAKGTPDGYLGSLGLFTGATEITCEPQTAAIDGTAHFGYVWGKFDRDTAGIGSHVGWGGNLASQAWNHIHGRHWLGDDSWWEAVDPSVAFQSMNKTVDPGAQGAHTSGYQTSGPAQSTYGPLVGNPAMKDFAHARVDGTGNVFWFPQEAPDWLTFPLKQAAALTAQAAAKAAADAAKADAAAQAKQAADAQAAQAQQDAQNALAESQAASQAKQQMSAAQAAQADVETQAQQQVVQQAQADLAQQQLETEQSKQAGEIMVKQAQQLLSQLPPPSAPAPGGYEEASSEEDGEEAAPSDEGSDEGSGEEGGDEEEPMPGEDSSGTVGFYEDGRPIPGGDMMGDWDGEGFSE